MEITSIIEIWKWFKWLPNFVLRKVFSKERLSELIYIDVKPRGEAVRVNLNETSFFDIWLQIINMTPFEIELDRAEFDISFSGVGIKNKHLKKAVIKSGQIYNLHISDSIDGSKSDVLKRMANTSNDSSISLYGVFNCSLHQFEKDNIHLGGVNVKYNGIQESVKGSSAPENELKENQE
ncbi:hypothetical protein QFX18_15165 [Saccharophagus degradans]|uniref:hypothetical protein n=1 Tax=Saccharophagus degradans TaxID=86304 RepID=UPI002477ED31|nr:hypothetical protein [Saccharophagus degradans]WGO97376.1 hypothetical protein QFX18_15165 [Saccharophagus degradans]